MANTTNSRAKRGAKKSTAKRGAKKSPTTKKGGKKKPVTKKKVNRNTKGNGRGIDTGVAGI